MKSLSHLQPTMLRSLQDAYLNRSETREFFTLNDLTARIGYLSEPQHAMLPNCLIIEIPPRPEIPLHKCEDHCTYIFLTPHSWKKFFHIPSLHGYFSLENSGPERKQPCCSPEYLDVSAEGSTSESHVPDSIMSLSCTTWGWQCRIVPTMLRNRDVSSGFPQRAVTFLFK